MILIDTIAINRGGGKILLDYLIFKIEKNKTNVLFLIDKRIENNHSDIKNNKCYYLNNNFIDRFIFYFKNKNKFSKVFCFANYLPPIKLNSKVITFFQNVAIFDKLRYPGIFIFYKLLNYLYQE